MSNTTKVLLIIPPQKGDDIMSSADALRYEALSAEQDMLTSKLYTEFLTPLKRKTVFDKLDAIGRELARLRSK